MKETYNYATKSKAREVLKDVVREAYPSPKQRKSLRVLTLLGHEDTELREIWDPLEVPRSNILSVESNPNVYALITSRNLGIQVVNSTLERFLEQNHQTFDVINYDSVSPFGLLQRDILRYMAGTQILGERGVLATWFLGRREGRYNLKWFERAFQKYQNDTSETTGKVKDRSNLLSRMICSIFIDGITNSQPHTLALSPVFIEEYKKYLAEKGYSIEMQVHHAIGGDFVKDKILHILTASGKKHNPTIRDYLYYGGIGAYFSQSQRRLKYTGDRGTPMLVDINLFKQEDLDIWSIGINRKQPVLKISPNLDKGEIKKKFDIFVDSRYRCFGESLTPRENLGSSYKPRPKRDKISKEDAIVLIDAGVPTEEIFEAYPDSFTKMQLAAFKAHHTMGRYELSS